MLWLSLRIAPTILSWLKITYEFKRNSRLLLRHNDGGYLNYFRLQGVDLILGSLVPGREARFPSFL